MKNSTLKEILDEYTRQPKKIVRFREWCALNFPERMSEFETHPIMLMQDEYDRNKN
jgi:hypothetical protein